jgi:cyclophilin family peptidyl-prolyl cis-trans isomerase
MGTAKRERQKQGRQARLAEAQAAAARRKRTRMGVLLAGLVVVLVGVTLAVGGLGGDDEDVASGASSTSTTAAGSTAPTVLVTIPPAGATLTGETPCPAADGSSARTTTFAQAPPTCIDPAKTYTATIATSHGDITLALDQAAAPVTVNNFVVLSRYHYYDGVTFHRIIPQFMIQAGDAVGPTPGQGGPGYTIADELPAAGGTDGYPAGTLAMANSGPNTSGSQFFIMATGSSGLDPAYSVFGHVTAGQDVVDQINQLGDELSNGTPTAEVVIESVTITET